MDNFQIKLTFKIYVILHLKCLVEMIAKSSKQQTEMLVSMLIKSNRIKTLCHFGQGLL